MYKKLLLILTAAFCLFFFSCSNSMFMNYMNYNQKPGSSGGGNSGGSGGDNFEEEPENTQNLKFSANFKYILPNGEIDESYTGDKDALKTKYNFSPYFRKYSTTQLHEQLFRITYITKDQIPSMQFEPHPGVWNADSKNPLVYTYGPSGTQGFTVVSVVTVESKNVIYYRYTRGSPFYSARGVYNTVKFKKNDNSIETIMHRFNYYRWSGEVAGQTADTYMIALDTYTGLVYGFAKITDSRSMMGQDIPTVFSAIDSFPSIKDSKKYAFYEYDPAGYLDSNGNIVLHQWYKDNIAVPVKTQIETTAIAYPITGKSPYYNDGSNEIDGIVENQNGYPVTGTLTVILKYLKNISMHGTVIIGGIVKNDNAQFNYTLGYSAYAGNESEAPVPVILETATGKEIKKDKIIEMSKSSTFSFLNETRKLNFEIDASIDRINGDKIAVSTSRQNGGIPYSFVYDRVAQVWKHISGTTIADNKPQEIKVQYDTPDGSMELCYTVTWQREYTVTDKGNMLMPAMNSTGEDTQVFLSGGVNEYSLEYTDADIGSVNEHKMIELDLLLHNLKTDAQPVDIFLPTTNSNNLINNARLNGTTLVKRGGTYGTASIPVTFTLLKNEQGAEREASIVIRLLYPSSGYDTQYSPKEITLNVKRKQQESE